jgi:hypothetical protein
VEPLANVIPVVAAYFRPPAALRLRLPVPPSPNVDVLLTCNALTAADDTATVPLLTKLAPFTLNVTLLFAATVMLALIVVSAELVAVTGPPLRLSVVVPAPTDFEKMRVCPAVGAIVIAPPVVVNVADEPSGEMTLRGFAPPPEVSETDEADTVEPAPRLMVGLAS